MYPVNTKVGEDDEQRELENVIEQKRGICWRIIEFTVSADFSKEAGRRKDGHERH